MSHKTGKRVLATTATSALAFAGLIAMPMVAHAAPGDVTLTNVCGPADTVTLKKNTGVYRILLDGVEKASVNTTLATPTISTPTSSTTSRTADGTATDAGVEWHDAQDGTLVQSWVTGTANDQTLQTPYTSPAGASIAANGAYWQDVRNQSLSIGAGANLDVDSTDTWGDGTTTIFTPTLTAGGPGAAITKITYSNGGLSFFSGSSGATPEGTATLSSAGVATTYASNAATWANPNIRYYAAVASAGARNADGTPLDVTGVAYSSSSTGSTTTSADTNAAGDAVVTLDSSYYNTPADGSKPLKGTFAVYQGTTLVQDATVVNGPLVGTDCSITSVTAPTQRVTATNGGTLTLTKGEGITWSISGAASYNGSQTVVANNTSDLFGGLMPNATPDSTLELAVAQGQTVRITGAVAPGYSGVDFAARDYKFDGSTQVNWVAPVTNDRDGKDSDTVTLSNIPGVTYYYKVFTGANTSASDTAADSGLSDVVNLASGGDQTTANNVLVANTTWTAVPSGSGPTLGVTRPSSMTKNDTLAIVAFADATHKFTAAGNRKETAKATFTDETKIRSIPAPTMVDGPGSEDYYILPPVTGAMWTATATDAQNNQTVMVYRSGDPRLGQQIPVFTSNPPVTIAFKAEADPQALDSNNVAGNYAIDATVVTRTTWSKTFDNRAAVTPQAPSFHDVTGFIDDEVTFPGLQSGLEGYQYAITVGNAAPTAGTGAVNTDWRYADYGWYGKTVKLSELQRAAGVTNVTGQTHVWIKTKANGTTAVLATDADGRDVRAAWDYNFTNLVVVNPEPPAQAAVAGDPTRYTLTFPTNTNVIYSVTDAAGITRDVAYSDLGKALPYSGNVTVRARSANDLVYKIAPNPDGSAPAPWQFGPILAEVTPGRPHSHDVDGTDQDTYEIPAQAGVLWTVDGANADPSTYGQRISTGGKTEIRFVARPASGYSFTDTAETSFTLHWSDGVAPVGLPAPDVDHSLLDSGWQAKVSWDGPEGAAGVTYDVSFAKVTEDEDGEEVVGSRTTWFEGTTRTDAQINAGYGTKYRVFVTATDEHGTESEEGETTITFDQEAPTSGWTDINRETVTPSGNDARGWYQARSADYFNNTAFVTYRDQSNITFTVNGGQQLRVYGTQYTKGGRALIQVNGTNWAWLDAGASSNADPYKKMLRQINLPNTGTHTIKIIASLLPGKELALDAYEVVK